MDGCARVSVLIGGTTKFYRERINPHLTAYESAVQKLTGFRPARLSPEEQRAYDRHTQPGNDRPPNPLAEVLGL